jgi:hypothetical protein
VPQCLLAGFGEDDAAPRALHDRLADHSFDPAQMLAHRGLTQVQSGGGTVEAAAVGDGDKAAQWRDIENLGHSRTVIRSG